MSNCVQEIIGIQSISLYPNSDIELIRPDISNENEVNLIANGEGSYTISNPVLLPKWERIVGYSGNYKQNYVDEFKFMVNGIENEIPAILKDLRNNRVGYIAEILTTGNQNYVFQSPVFLNNSNTKKIDSHSWEVSLSYRIPSFLDKLIKLETILTNDPEILSADIEIVGIKKMSLYISRDVSYRHLDPSNENEIALISPTEPFIIINDVNQLPKWERITDNSGNYKQNYSDGFSFLLHGIENDVPEIIKDLRNNRSGYIIEVVTTGNQNYIFLTPVFLDENNTKQIDSHSWKVSLSYRIPSFRGKLTLAERPVVEYRNGIVSNSFFGNAAVFDFEAKISSNTPVTFTINWGAEVGTTVINSTLVNGIWKALQTSILIPDSINANQTILVTDNFGDSYEVEYTIVQADISITLDMSTPSTAGFNLTFASGSLNMDWDDGGGLVPFVSGVELLKTYVSPGTKTIKISGDLDQITRFIADNSKITFIENLKTGLLTQFDIRSNLYSGNLDLINAPVSGSFRVDSNAGLTGIDFATSGNGILTFIVLRLTGFIGVLNLSNNPVSTYVEIRSNPGMTGIIFAASGNGIVTAFRLYSNNLTGNLDLSNVPVGTLFNAYLNPLLTSVTHSSSGNSIITSYLLYSCNITGNHDISNVPIGTIFDMHSNALLTSITHSTTGNTITITYFVYSCNITGNHDLSNVPTSSNVILRFNPNMINITLAGSGNGTLNIFDMDGCSLPNIDLSVYTSSTPSEIDFKNNSMSATEHDNQYINLDGTGWINGTLQILTGNTARTAASDTAYNNLIANGWSLS